MSNLSKILLLGGFLIISNSILSQKDTTILFLNGQPEHKESLKKIKKSWIGKYGDTTKLAWLEINQRGIFKITAVMMQMEQSKVEKNEKYEVRNEFIFGVKKNDSLPAVLENGIYHFAYPYKNEVYSFNGEYDLKQMDESMFLLSTKDMTVSTYQLSQFYFAENSVEYYSFDQYQFALKNDSLSTNHLEIDEYTIVKSLMIKDPEFFDYPGIQKYFQLENVFIREEK